MTTPLADFKIEEHNDIFWAALDFISSDELILLKVLSKTTKSLIEMLMDKRCKKKTIRTGTRLKFLIRIYCGYDMNFIDPSPRPRSKEYICFLLDGYGLPMNQWDVSAVKNFSLAFYGMRNFNEDISNWNTSNGRDMGFMFGNAVNFNQDLSRWNVSNVTRMHCMFCNARRFNSNIDGWDVSQVENFSFAFYGMRTFNEDISIVGYQ